MFTTAVLTAAMLAPTAPLPKAPAVAGPAPYILRLSADGEGKIRLPVMRMEKQKVTVLQAIGAPGGNQAVQPIEQEVTVQKYVMSELSELKDIKVYSVAGKELDIKDATKKIVDGGMVIASANGQKVDSEYLKLFKDDVLILVSPELVPGNLGFGWSGGSPILPGRPMPPVQVQPLPAVVPGFAPAQPDMAPAVEAPVTGVAKPAIKVPAVAKPNVNKE